MKKDLYYNVKSVIRNLSIVSGDTIAKFVASRCVIRKLRRNFGFFCSVNNLSGPLRKQMFTCDWSISIHFVCFCLSRFVACDRTVSGNS